MVFSILGNCLMYFQLISMLLKPALFQDGLNFLIVKLLKQRISTIKLNNFNLFR
jgi:hypothetical protein